MKNQKTEGRLTRRVMRRMKRVESVIDNEVIVYRVMMYTNPFLIVQVMYFTSEGQSVYLSTRGVIFENI